MSNRKPCEYDRQRKKETVEKLQRGIQQMKSQKEFKNKPLSFYGLSKITGVAVNTIKTYPSIVETIEESKHPTVKLKCAHVKAGAIRRLEDAQAVVDTLEKMYNETADKYNSVMDANLKLNLELVKLQDENAELRHQIKLILSGTGGD